ncbi:MAG: hypothetical protein WCP20_19265 [Desulfuromonadales bacterium]
MIISVGGTYEPLVKVKEELGEFAQKIRFEIEILDNENDLPECHEKGNMAVRRVQQKG